MSTSLRAATMATLSAIALWGSSPSAGAADICKWVDDQGRTHYSSIEPAGRACQRVIRVEHADPAEQARAQERRQRLLDEAGKVEQAREEKTREARREADKVAERQGRCEDARAELRFLREAYGMRLARPGTAGGEGAIDWIDDTEREELTDAWRKEVDKWCGSAGAVPEGAPPERAYGVPPPIKRKPR